MGSAQLDGVRLHRGARDRQCAAGGRCERGVRAGPGVVGGIAAMALANHERLKQTIDGQLPTAESRLALTPRPDPLNLDISPDGKTLYSQPMSGNALFAYDLTGEGD